MLLWQKSTYSGGGDGDHCIEVADAENAAALREGDDPGTVLAARPDVLAAFIHRLKSGI